MFGINADRILIVAIQKYRDLKTFKSNHGSLNAAITVMKKTRVFHISSTKKRLLQYYLPCGNKLMMAWS